jgi:hypothetical protein
LGVILEINIQLLEGVLNYCRDGQCTNTLEHIVEAFRHVACHLTVPPSALIKSSCPQWPLKTVVLKKVVTTRIKAFMRDQSVVQECEVTLGKSETTILKIVRQLLVLTCPIEV